MAHSDRLRVALLCGGTSGERQVSLMGAEQVEEYLDPEKYLVTRYDTANDLVKLAGDAANIDVALIILHGPQGEDGTIQGMLELFGIPYQGSGVLGSGLAMDKNLSKELYALHNLPVAKWRMVDTQQADVQGLCEQLSFPLVVKPVRVGSSLGMTIAKTPEQLRQGIDTALSHDSEVMIEEYIEGIEITVAVLGNDQPEGLPIVEIIPNDKYEFFDYEAKYQPGATMEICPARIEPQIRDLAQQYAVTAHKVLKLRGYSRTDMILTATGQLYLLETNTIPGMTKTSLFPQAAKEHGLEYGQMLDRLIELALEK